MKQFQFDISWGTIYYKGILRFVLIKSETYRMVTLHLIRFNSTLIGLCMETTYLSIHHVCMKQ